MSEEKLKVYDCLGCLACPSFQNGVPQSVMNWVIAKGLTVQDLGSMDKDRLYNELGVMMSQENKIEFRQICEGLVELHQDKPVPITHSDYFGKWEKISTGCGVTDMFQLKGGISRASTTLLLQTNGVMGWNKAMKNVINGIYGYENKNYCYEQLHGVKRDRGLIIETRASRNIGESMELDDSFITVVNAHASEVTGGLSADRLNDISRLIEGDHYSVVVLDALCNIDPLNDDQVPNLSTVERWTEFLNEKLDNFKESAFIVLVTIDTDDNPLEYAREKGFMLPGTKVCSKLMIGSRSATSIMGSRAVENN